MSNVPCATDLTLGSSLLVLSALVISDKAMRQFPATEGLAGKLIGQQDLGILGLVVVGWFAVKFFQLWSGQCKPSMKNGNIEKSLTAVGLGLGLFSLYLEYY